MLWVVKHVDIEREPIRCACHVAQAFSQAPSHNLRGLRAHAA
jgi:hypothetical protein